MSYMEQYTTFKNIQQHRCSMQVLPITKKESVCSYHKHVIAYTICQRYSLPNVSICGDSQ